MGKEILIQGTGTDHDGRFMVIPDDLRVLTLVIGPRPRGSLGIYDPGTQPPAALEVETVDLHPTGVHIPEEIWCPMDKMWFYRSSSQPNPESKPPPKEVLTLISEEDVNFDGDSEEDGSDELTDELARMLEWLFGGDSDSDCDCIACRIGLRCLYR